MDINDLKIEYEKFLAELKTSSAAACDAAEKARQGLAGNIASFHGSPPRISNADRAEHFKKISAAQEDLTKAMRLWVELDERLKAYELPFDRIFGLNA